MNKAFKNVSMECNNERWVICFDKSRTKIYLDGALVFDEPTIVSRNNKGRVIDIGENATHVDPQDYTLITPITSGVVVDFEAATFFLKTVFRNRLKRKHKVESICAILPEELGNIEERAVKEALEEISKTVRLIYSSIESGNHSELTGVVDAINTPKKTSNIIADEIVCNIKMIGLAILLASIYVVFFLISHHDDRKPVQTVEWGQSCYDNTSEIKGDYELDWQRIYYDNWMSKNVDEYYKLRIREHGNQEEFDFVGWRNTHDFDDSILLQSAFHEVEQNESMLEAEENSIRLSQAKDDLWLHIKYSLIIAIAAMVLGRYVFKLLQ